MTNVLNLPVVTKLPLPVERIVDGARDADLAEIVVLGYTKEGKFYFASSEPDGADVLWLLEAAKLELLKIAGVPG